MALKRPSPRRKPPRGLRPDDFRRLGLELSEARVTVIRRAAGEMAASLSDKPADGELAQMLTSAYRLLDPRRRDRLRERVQLLRAEPTPVRTSLIGDDSSIVSELTESASLVDDDADDQWMLEMLADLRTDPLPPGRNRPSGQKLAHSRQQSDIAGLRQLRSSITQNHLYVFAAVAAFGVFLILFAMVVSSWRRTPVRKAVAVDVEVPSSPEVLPAPIIPEPAPPELTTPQPSPQPSVADVAPLPNGNDSSKADLEEVDVVEPSLPEVPLPDLPEPAELMPTELILESDEEGNKDQPLNQPPFAAPIQMPLPTADEVAAARSQVQDVFPGLRQQRDVGRSQLFQVWQQASAQPAGSPLQFASILFVIERAIIDGDLALADRLVALATEQYEASMLQIAQLALIAASTEAVTLTEHERVCQWALRLADRACLEDEYQLATEATRLGTQSAVESKQTDLRSRAKLRRDSLTASERMAKTTAELLAQLTLDKASPSDAQIIARHLCLNQRRWDEGLPWMAAGRDPRLASLAREEMAFIENSDSKTLMDLANRWMEAASSQRGAAGESISLHARDLMVEASQRASGVDKLEIEKQIDTINQQLPVELRPLEKVDEKTLLPSANDTATTADDRLVIGEITDPLSLGLLGRINVSGQDTGLVLEYPTHTLLRQPTLQPILRQRGFLDGVYFFEFHGYLFIEQATTVTLEMQGLLGTTLLTIAGQQIPFTVSPSDLPRGTARVDIPAGMHRVVWQVSGERLPSQRLICRDDRDGKVLHFRHDETTRATVERLPVVTRIRMRP